MRSMLLPARMPLALDLEAITGIREVASVSKSKRDLFSPTSVTLPIMPRLPVTILPSLIARSLPALMKSF